ncbi:MAG: YlmC/YmxH family sporulation protein [Oscillospiraceae bacterium]|nr:YlmC/YmxH family sporulation protein [Oscillospiraceae bacterium]
MQSSLSDLRFKEVISVTDGTRYGYVADLSFSIDTGQITSLIVPGQGKYFFGLLGRRETRLVRWDQIRRIGQDIILVEGELLPMLGRKGRKSWLTD